MNPDRAREIGDIIGRHQSFVIGGHVRPDGDVLGCQIALGLVLQALGKTVEVWNPDGMSQKYSFLPHADLVQKPPDKSRAADVLLAVDTAAYDRLGAVRELVSPRKLIINIDHHASNPGYGDVNWIDAGAAASGELVYELLRVNNWPVTPDIAANLFVAIATDTGSFQYPSTTPRSLRIGADLVEAGADVGELSRLCFENYPLRRARLLQAVLANMKLSANDRIGSFWITEQMYRDAGAFPEDSEGLIDHVRAIDTVLVAVLFEADTGGRIRLSFRSKTDKVSVDKIAAQFGGGGHVAAAGARAKGDPAAVEAAVLKAVEDAVHAAGY